MKFIKSLVNLVGSYLILTERLTSQKPEVYLYSGNKPLFFTQNFCYGIDTVTEIRYTDNSTFQNRYLTIPEITAVSQVSDEDPKPCNCPGRILGQVLAHVPPRSDGWCVTAGSIPARLNGVFPR